MKNWEQKRREEAFSKITFEMQKCIAELEDGLFREELSKFIGEVDTPENERDRIEKFQAKKQDLFTTYFYLLSIQEAIHFQAREVELQPAVVPNITKLTESAQKLLKELKIVTSFDRENRTISVYFQ